MLLISNASILPIFQLGLIIIKKTSINKIIHILHKAMMIKNKNNIIYITNQMLEIINQIKLLMILSIK